MSKSKEEAPFDYDYGFSFFFAVMSFLTQELNGICNIYWYVDYYRKYKYDAATSDKAVSHASSMFQIPTIKVNDVVTSDANLGPPPPPPPPQPPLSGVLSQPPASLITAATPSSITSSTSAQQQTSSRPFMNVNMNAKIVRKQSSGSSSGAVSSIGFFGRPPPNATQRPPPPLKQSDLTKTTVNQLGKSVIHLFFRALIK